MKKHEDEESQPPVLVPREILSEETLQALIESFVLREGTDYGAQEISLQTKIDQVLKQLKKEEIKIVFDPNSESVTLMTAHEWKKLQARQV